MGKEVTYYNVAPETYLYSAPLGDRGSICYGKANEMLTVWAKSNRKVNGKTHFFCEVVEPPKRKGEIFWVENIEGIDTGFRKT